MSLLLMAIIAFVGSLGLVALIMPHFIKLLKNHDLNQEVSEYALEEYKQKAKTPIMGGLMFVAIPSLFIFIIQPKIINDRYCLFVILSYVLFCLVGFIDDFIILVRKNNLGLSPKAKLAMEFVFALGLYFFFRDIITTVITIPFANTSFDLGIFYPVFMLVMYMSEANAVNFTDGMDGLCAGVSFITLLPFLMFAIINSQYNIFLLILCVLGGLIGYLFYNFHPAKIFMGDSGSIGLGGLFSALAVVLNKEIALFVGGGVFVVEMMCVVIQQLSVRLFHKRVFAYTPIHYAFVLKGHKEVKVVINFYILAFVFSLIGFILGVFGGVQLL